MTFDWYVIVRGGLFDRITLYGPYKGQDKANDEVELMREWCGDTLTVQPLWGTHKSAKVRKRK